MLRRWRFLHSRNLDPRGQHVRTYLQEKERHCTHLCLESHISPSLPTGPASSPACPPGPSHGPPLSSCGRTSPARPADAPGGYSTDNFAEPVIITVCMGRPSNHCGCCCFVRALALNLNPELVTAGVFVSVKQENFFQHLKGKLNIIGVCDLRKSLNNVLKRKHFCYEMPEVGAQFIS